MWKLPGSEKCNHTAKLMKSNFICHQNWGMELINQFLNPESREPQTQLPGVGRNPVRSHQNSLENQKYTTQFTRMKMKYEFRSEKSESRRITGVLRVQTSPPSSASQRLDCARAAIILPGRLLENFAWSWCDTYQLKAQFAGGGVPAAWLQVVRVFSQIGMCSNRR